MINTVKIKGDGYLLNGVLNVPISEGNRHYKAIKKWIDAGNTPEPEYTQAELDAKKTAEENEATKAELKKIDLDSIRAIREYIASKADAPQILKDREAAAVVKRGKLK